MHPKSFVIQLMRCLHQSSAGSPVGVYFYDLSLAVGFKV